MQQYLFNISIVFLTQIKLIDFTKIFVSASLFLYNRIDDTLFYIREPEIIINHNIKLLLRNTHNQNAYFSFMKNYKKSMLYLQTMFANYIVKLSQALKIIV